MSLKQAHEEVRDANYFVADQSKHFGNRIRRARLSTGIGLREMARGLKISAAYLSDMELGRRLIPVAMGKAIIKYLDKSATPRPQETP